MSYLFELPSTNFITEMFQGTKLRTKKVYRMDLMKINFTKKEKHNKLTYHSHTPSSPSKCIWHFTVTLHSNITQQKPYIY